MNRIINRKMDNSSILVTNGLNLISINVLKVTFGFDYKKGRVAIFGARIFTHPRSRNQINIINQCDHRLVCWQSLKICVALVKIVTAFHSLPVMRLGMTTIIG